MTNFPDTITLFVLALCHLCFVLTLDVLLTFYFLPNIPSCVHRNISINNVPVKSSVMVLLAFPCHTIVTNNCGNNTNKQAGAKRCQAQFKLGLAKVFLLLSREAMLCSLFATLCSPYIVLCSPCNVVQPICNVMQPICRGN